MITWRKLMGSGQVVLPNLIFLAAIRCCAPQPVLNPITPDTGSQGTDVMVILTGDWFDNCNCVGCMGICVDGGVPFAGYCGMDGVVITGCTVRTDTEADCTLHIDPAARTGKHTVTVSTYGGTSIARWFTVTCPGCPPPPELVNIVAQPNNSPLIPGGPPVTFQLVGTNFLNNNPQVQIDGAGISFPPGPYNVVPADYFLLDVTADATATTGDHAVRVINDGGTSNIMTITVAAPRPSPTPGPSPFLSRITPMHIARYVFPGLPGVSVKFEGTGFGTGWWQREILVDPNNTIINFNTRPTDEANPNEVVVGNALLYFPTGPDTSVTVRVHNLENDTVSNPLVLSLDDLGANAPHIYTAYLLGLGYLQPNGDADLYIEGQNLQGLTDQTFRSCFSGIPGLTFSNFVSYSDSQKQVHVHADASAPLSDDQATNLVITTTDGQSNPFWIQILPP